MINTAKKEFIGFAIIPKGQVVNFLLDKENYLSSKYKTYTGLKQSPNIAIKWPFEVGDINPFLDYFKKIVKEIKPFKIKIKGTGFFEESKALFLKVESSKELIELHLKILKDLKEKFGIEKNWYEGSNQQFHLTLAYKDITDENFRKALDEINNWDVNFEFLFDSVGFFIHGPSQDEWSILKEIKIGKNENTQSTS